MTRHTLLDKMTKEDLVKAVQDYGCGRLRSLPLDYMTKQQIVEHLKQCSCPVIKKLLNLPSSH